jgi:hypothetical protein
MKLVTLVILAALAGGAEARVQLKDDVTIENGLKTVAIGKMLYKGCDRISPRRIKAFAFARSLQLRARELGYSDAEIDAYLDSDTDKGRVKSKARAYLAAKGVDFANPATLCVVGAAEIKEQTAVGRFLRLR